MRKTQAIAALVMLVAFIFGAAGKSDAQPVQPLNVVFVGDSIVAGIGADAGQDWPSVYGALSHANVTNLGHPGQCLSIACYAWAPLYKTVEAEALSLNPDVLVIGIGVNDIGRVTTSQMQSAYRAIVRMARQYGVPVIFATVTPKFGLPSDTQRKAVNSWLVQNYETVDMSAAVSTSKGALAKAYDSGDHLHPNATGYRRMAGVMVVHMR